MFTKSWLSFCTHSTRISKFERKRFDLLPLFAWMVRLQIDTSFRLPKYNGGGEIIDFVQSVVLQIEISVSQQDRLLISCRNVALPRPDRRWLRALRHSRPRMSLFPDLVMCRASNAGSNVLDAPPGHDLDTGRVPGYHSICKCCITVGSA